MFEFVLFFIIEENRKKKIEEEGVWSQVWK